MSFGLSFLHSGTDALMDESLHGMVVTFAQLGRTLQPCHGRIHGQETKIGGERTRLAMPRRSGGTASVASRSAFPRSRRRHLGRRASWRLCAMCPTGCTPPRREREAACHGPHGGYTSAPKFEFLNIALSGCFFRACCELASSSSSLDTASQREPAIRRVFLRARQCGLHRGGVAGT